MLLTFDSLGQELNVINYQGKVVNAETGAPISSVSVAMYLRVDSSLISYQLTNNGGRYLFNHVKDASNSYLMLSHVGFITKTLNIDRSGLLSENEIPTIKMSPKTIQMDEVEVFIPPVRLNGDTLEFNADAFRLDPNAVVDDLLRKLPGVTIWGDGKITVNGREIKRLLVDGKVFFGGDTKTAVQNLPKKIVDKIQVYNDKSSKSSVQDSLLHMNIKLKKGKNYGVFGKLGGGAGSNKRFIADGVVSGFNQKTQISLGGATNNTNQSAHDMASLIKNTSFKGVSAVNEYQPNFDISGLYTSKMFGGKFSNDVLFKSDRDYKRIGGEFYSKNRSGVVSNMTNREYNLESRSLLESSNYQDNLNETIKNGLVTYRSRNEIRTIEGDLSLTTNQSHLSHLGERTTSENMDVQLTSQKEVAKESEDSKKMEVKFYIDQSNFSVRYQGFINKSLKDKLYTSDNKLDNSSSKGLWNFNRNYDSNFDNREHKLDLSYDVKHIFLGNSDKYRDWNINLRTNSIIKIDEGNVVVKDYDTETAAYKSNIYLTNQFIDRSYDNRPNLVISRYFRKEYPNRYDKTLLTQVEIRGQLLIQDTGSDKERQRYNLKKANFIPKAEITYIDRQFGNSETIVSLKYDSWTNLSSFDQRASLLDSAHLYALRLGNPHLTPSNTKEFNISYDFSSRHNRHLVDNFYISAKKSYISNAFTDSINFDSNGRGIYQTVNIHEGGENLYISLNSRKAFKHLDHQFQLQLKANYMLSTMPKIINETKALSSSTIYGGDLSLLYTHKDWLMIQLEHSLTNYGSKFSSNTFTSGTQRSALNFSVNFLKRLTFQNDLSYNTNDFQMGDNNFVRWNSTFILRLFKSNQGEFKLSLFDVLKQNRSVVSFSDAYGVTTGYTNALQQYIMVGFSYYPRIFAK